MIFPGPRGLQALCGPRATIAKSVERKLLFPLQFSLTSHSLKVNFKKKNWRRANIVPVYKMSDSKKVTKQQANVTVTINN